MVNRYMLVLQRTHGGQDALEFDKNGVAHLVPIEPFTDQKKYPKSKSDRNAPKKTLAFYDAITTRHRNFDHFLSVVGETIYPFDYKPSMSFLGFVNNKFINTLSLSFNDNVLAGIAENVEGSMINKNHRPTMHAVMQLVDLIEDPESDFVDKLKKTFDQGNKNYHFSRSFVNSIVNYHALKREEEIRNRHSTVMSDVLREDVEVFKIDFLDKIQSYINFRELYRFRKNYIYDKEMERFQPKKTTTNETRKQQSDITISQYEEARQKTYIKEKTPSRVGDQFSLFD